MVMLSFVSNSISRVSVSDSTTGEGMDKLIGMIEEMREEYAT